LPFLALPLAFPFWVGMTRNVLALDARNALHGDGWMEAAKPERENKWM